MSRNSAPPSTKHCLRDRRAPHSRGTGPGTATRLLPPRALCRLATAWLCGRCGSPPSTQPTSTGFAPGRKARHWPAPCLGRPSHPRPGLSRLEAASRCAPRGPSPSWRPSTTIPVCPTPGSTRSRRPQCPMLSRGSGTTMRATRATCQPVVQTSRRAVSPRRPGGGFARSSLSHEQLARVTQSQSRLSRSMRSTPWAAVIKAPISSSLASTRCRQ